MTIKRAGGKNKVVAFLGDMTAETGIVHESVKYAANYRLPLVWVVEDNEYSVGTRTDIAWGEKSPMNLQTFKYTNRYPHCGLGKWVQF